MFTKICIVVVSTALIAGCSLSSRPSIVDQSQIRVISPPAALLNCPELKNIPNPETLTNRQIAQTIEQLIRNNRTCKINMNEIKKFIAEAEKIANR